MKKYVNRWICFFVVFLGIGVIHSDTFGGEKLIFGTHLIPRMVVDAHSGVFIELTRTLADRSKLEIEIVVIPPKRAIAYFQDQRFDVLFPGMDVYFPPGHLPVKSEELITVKCDFVFTKKGTPMLTTIDDLRGKRVGITLGYPYTRELLDNPHIIFDKAPSDEINTKKLIAGRIDAFVVEERTGTQAFLNTGLQEMVQYDKAAPISEQEVYYAFQDTEKGRQLAHLITQALREMKEDGTFAEIMQKGDVNSQK